MRLGRSRTQRQRTFVMHHGGVEIVEFGEQIAEIEMGVREAGIDGQRPVIAADRLLAAAGGVEAAAEIDVGVDQAGLDRDRLGIVRDRIVKAIEMPAGVAEADANDGGFR